MAKSPTRMDVARLAKVSSATVSRTYNHPGSVKDEVRERVLEAAKVLDYVPNRQASFLRKGSTGAIALVEKKKPRGVENRLLSTLFADVVRSIQSVLDGSAYHLNLFSVSTAKDIQKISESSLCDGIIAHDLESKVLCNAVRDSGLPYVCAFREPDKTLSQVYLDEHYGGELVAKEFQRMKRHCPAHITGELKSVKTCQRRFKGFQSAYTQDVVLVDGALGIEGGYLSGKKLCKDIKSGKVDSIFVVNDITAIGVWYALSEADLSVPNDVSLISYDNLPILDTLPKRLTTVDISFWPIYTRVTEKLMAALSGSDDFESTPAFEMIKPILVKGDSV